MENLKSKNILLTIMGILIVVSFAAQIIRIISTSFTGTSILMLLLLVFVALYGFWLYKKPHGNMLKYAFLLFALVGILKSAYYLNSGTFPVLNCTAILVVCGIVCYCAGRLNRIEQNRIIFPIVDLVILADSIYKITHNIPESIYYLVSMEYFIVFTTLMIAYFTRYKAHKEAGLADAPKK